MAQLHLRKRNVILKRTMESLQTWYSRIRKSGDYEATDSDEDLALYVIQPTVFRHILSYSPFYATLSTTPAI